MRYQRTAVVAVALSTALVLSRGADAQRPSVNLVNRHALHHDSDFSGPTDDTTWAVEIRNGATKTILVNVRVREVPRIRQDGLVVGFAVDEYRHNVGVFRARLGQATAAIDSLPVDWVGLGALAIDSSGQYLAYIASGTSARAGDTLATQPHLETPAAFRYAIVWYRGVIVSLTDRKVARESAAFRVMAAGDEAMAGAEFCRGDTAAFVFVPAEGNDQPRVLRVSPSGRHGADYQLAAGRKVCDPPPSTAVQARAVTASIASAPTVAQGKDASERTLFHAARTRPRAAYDTKRVDEGPFVTVRLTVSCDSTGPTGLLDELLLAASPSFVPSTEEGKRDQAARRAQFQEDRERYNCVLVPRGLKLKFWNGYNSTFGGKTRSVADMKIFDSEEYLFLSYDALNGQARAEAIARANDAMVRDAFYRTGGKNYEFAKALQGDTEEMRFTWAGRPNGVAALSSASSPSSSPSPTPPSTQSTSCEVRSAERLLLSQAQVNRNGARFSRNTIWQKAGPCSWLVTGYIEWVDQLSNQPTRTSFSAAVSGSGGRYSIDMWQLTGR